MFHFTVITYAHYMAKASWKYMKVHCQWCDWPVATSHAVYAVGSLMNMAGRKCLFFPWCLLFKQNTSSLTVHAVHLCFFPNFCAHRSRPRFNNENLGNTFLVKWCKTDSTQIRSGRIIIKTKMSIFMDTRRRETKQIYYITSSSNIIIIMTHMSNSLNEFWQGITRVLALINKYMSLSWMFPMSPSYLLLISADKDVDV